MKHPTKRAKYIGEIKALPGDYLISLPNEFGDNVITVRELFVGIVTGNNEGEQDELEFYVPEESVALAIELASQIRKELK